MDTKQTWEVLSYEGNSTSPKTIKRLSDNKIFELGQKVTNGTKMKGKIEKFEFSFKGNEIFVYTDWSGVGMGLESVSHIVPLPSKFQIDDKVLLVFNIDETKVKATVLAVHFYPNQVKYDIEVSSEIKLETRIYNISEWVLKNE
jgi:hypothetical protein